MGCCVAGYGFHVFPAENDSEPGEAHASTVDSAARRDPTEIPQCGTLGLWILVGKDRITVDGPLCAQIVLNANVDSRIVEGSAAHRTRRPAGLPWPHPLLGRRAASSATNNWHSWHGRSPKSVHGAPTCRIGSGALIHCASDQPWLHTIVWAYLLVSFDTSVSSTHEARADRARCRSDEQVALHYKHDLLLRSIA